MRIHSLFVLLLLTCFSAHQAVAQIVNIEKKRLGETEDGWYGTVDGGLNLIQNTRTIWQITSRANVQYNDGRHATMTMADFKLVMVENDRILNSGFGHARYNFAMNEKRSVVWEAFEQVSYNKVQRIDLRSLTGTGPRFTIFQGDSLELYIGTLGMYDYEEITDTSIINRDFRASAYLSFAQQVNKVVGINSISYFQPLFNDFADHRIANETTVSLRVTKKLEFRITWNMVFDSRPAEGIHELNYGLFNRLLFKFG